MSASCHCQRSSIASISTNDEATTSQLSVPSDITVAPIRMRWCFPLSPVVMRSCRQLKTLFKGIPIAFPARVEISTCILVRSDITSKQWQHQSQSAIQHLVDIISIVHHVCQKKIACSFKSLSLLMSPQPCVVINCNLWHCSFNPRPVSSSNTNRQRIPIANGSLWIGMESLKQNGLSLWTVAYRNKHHLEPCLEKRCWNRRFGPLLRAPLMTDSSDSFRLKRSLIRYWSMRMVVSSWWSITKMSRRCWSAKLRKDNFLTQPKSDLQFLILYIVTSTSKQHRQAMKRYHLASIRLMNTVHYVYNLELSSTNPNPINAHPPYPRRSHRAHPISSQNSS